MLCYKCNATGFCFSLKRTIPLFSIQCSGSHIRVRIPEKKITEIYDHDFKSIFFPYHFDRISFQQKLLQHQLFHDQDVQNNSLASHI